MISGAKWTIRLEHNGKAVERQFSSSIVANAFIGRAATIEITLDEMEREILNARPEKP